MHVGDVYHVNHDLNFTARFRSVIFFINTADNKKCTAKK